MKACWHITRLMINIGFDDPNLCRCSNNAAINTILSARPNKLTLKTNDVC